MKMNTRSKMSPTANLSITQHAANKLNIYEDTPKI